MLALLQDENMRICRFYRHCPVHRFRKKYKEKEMKKTIKIRIFILLIAAGLCISGMFFACGDNTESAKKPSVAPAVRSVTLQYEQKNVSGTLNVDVSFGTVQLTAVVTKDDGADGKVTYLSGTPSVAEINDSGLVTLKSSGETVISAAAGDKSHYIVLVVTDEYSETESQTFTITVTGGTASCAAAKAGDRVMLTPMIPESKQFTAWNFDDAILEANGNSFVMPASNVEISAVLVDKLASIYIASQPDDNRIVKGGTLRADGLKIMARAFLGGEEWNVTAACEFSDYDGGDKVRASYTLGDVTKSAEIAVSEQTSYRVAAESFRNESIGGTHYINAAPADINTEEYDKYRTSGYIAGTQDNNLRFSDQNGTYAVSNIKRNVDIEYYFWSDFEANTHIIANVASSDTYKTADATYSDDGPNAVRPVKIAQQCEVFVNGSEKSVAVNPTAQANAFIGSVNRSDWSVCGHFNETWIADMRVTKGWNTLRFNMIGSGTINLAGIEMRFTGAPLTEFVSDISLNMATAYTNTTAVNPKPVDPDVELAGHEDVGAVYLQVDPNYTGHPNNAMKFNNEGDHRAVTNMKKDESVLYYVWSSGNGTAEIVLTAASSTTDSSTSAGLPLSVHEVVLKDHYAFYINGDELVPSADVISPAYRDASGNGGWHVCQQFNKLTIGSAQIKAGWNEIEVKFVTGTRKITPAELNVNFIYQEKGGYGI